MNSRATLLGLSALLIVIGAFLGFRTVAVDDISCGSVFSPSSEEAERADFGEELGGTLQGATPDEDTSNNARACDDAVGNAKPLAYGALGLGVLALLLAFVVQRPRSESTT